MKKKVLIVGYMPPPYHGVVRMTEILKNSKLLNLEFNVEIFYLKSVDNAENRGKFAIRNIFLNLNNIFLFFVKCCFRKYDVLYLSLAQNNFGFIRDSIFVLIAKFFKIKTLVQYHAGDFQKNYSLKNNFFKFYIRYIYGNKIDRLIVLAEKIKIQFRDFINSNKVEVIYNFIEDTCIPAEFIEKDFIKKDFNILFIGYVSKAKGAVDLVKAGKIVIDKLSNYEFKFMLAGDFVNIERNVVYIDDPNGGYSEILDYISRNSLEDNIKLLGYVDSNLKMKLLKEADLFVLPSHSEGFPVSVLEAMSYGLPMILTKVGAIDEVLIDQKNRLFSEVGNYSDLAEKIIQIILDTELREKMAENNYKLVKNDFNLKKFENKIIDLFNTI
jgi:glycosyltransferase involved in cell wall biosynthesis